MLLALVSTFAFVGCNKNDTDTSSTVPETPTTNSPDMTTTNVPAMPDTNTPAAQ